MTLSPFACFVWYSLFARPIKALIFPSAWDSSPWKTGVYFPFIEATVAVDVTGVVPPVLFTGAVVGVVPLPDVLGLFVFVFVLVDESVESCCSFRSTWSVLVESVPSNWFLLFHLFQ